MRVVLLTSNSLQNFALSHKISLAHDLVGIVYENRFSQHSRLKNFLQKNKYNPFKVIRKAYEKIALRKLDNSFSDFIQAKYVHYTSFYPAPSMEVSNINDEAGFDFLKDKDFDVILVSGTQLVRKKLLSLKPKFGIINMHTGLSPYYNGGPSCTFWCLYNEDIHHIGATVMFIDSGIDTGNIILTDTVKVEPNDTYGTLEFKAIELGHDLILKALKKIESNPTFRGYKQNDIGKGYTFYNKDFTFKKRLHLQYKLKKGMIEKLFRHSDKPVDITTFPD